MDSRKASQSKAVTLKVEKGLTDTTVDLRSLLVRDQPFEFLEASNAFFFDKIFGSGTS
jgi:hypothetical protein